MATTNSPTRGVAEHRLVLARVFNAPRELVFAAWTEARHAAQWWGPRGFTTIECEIDARPGGRLRRYARAEDGLFYENVGVFLEVMPPVRLVFTYAWRAPDGTTNPETRVTVTFESAGSATLVRLVHELFPSEELRASHEGGWTGCLERFAEYIERTASDGGLGR